MKLARFELDGAAGYGLVRNTELLVCSTMLRDRYPDLKAMLARPARVPLGSVTLLPVIPNPEKILCVGLNYEMHRQETGRSEVANPTIFTRA